MKVVGFLNNKGGLGKTGSITTLAHMIATEYKRKVSETIKTKRKRYKAWERLWTCWVFGRKYHQEEILSLRSNPKNETGWEKV